METVFPLIKRPVLHSRVAEVNEEELEFGRYISDHMVVCDCTKGNWQTPQILPFSNLSINPATLALHYGQTVFEGMKAFRTHDGKVHIFRMQKHYERFARSLERMCMSVPPETLFTESLSELVRMDRNWVPSKRGAALYLRPFVYASEARFGLKISDDYRMIIFTGPVPELFSNRIKVKVETHFIRAGRGGTGSVKCGGNYGGAFFPTREARREGYDQVLWTTGGPNPTIEESGMMNVLFVIDDKIVTPPLSDSILDGVTRDSLLEIARDLGFVIEERTISVDELEEALLRKAVTEAFGAGTAAVVAPIETIHINGIDYPVPAATSESKQVLLKQRLDAIRYGTYADIHNWNYYI